MGDMIELLEVNDRKYDDWREHLEKKKKKLQFNANNSNRKKQQDAKDGLFVISCIDQLMDAIDKNNRSLTLGIKIICSMYDNGSLSNDLPVLVNAYKNDSDSIKAISESNLPAQLKKAWNRSLGKGVVDISVRYEALGRVLEVVCAVTPLLFLTFLVIGGLNVEWYDSIFEGAPSAFFYPLAAFLAIKYGSILLSKAFRFSFHGIGMKLGIFAGIASIILAFVSPIGNALKAINPDCRLLYLVYVYISMSIQLTNKISGPLVLLSELKDMIMSRKYKASNRR